MSQIGPTNPNAPKQVFSDDDKVKDQLTYFFPKEGWKGEYGFDWFRLHTCPEPEKFDEKGGKAEINFNNIGKHIYPSLKRLWIMVDYEEDPKGDVFTIETPAFTSDQRGVYVDVRSDDQRDSESNLSELEQVFAHTVDNDVDITRLMSGDEFATFYFRRGRDRIPVVCDKNPDGTFTNFRYYEYQSSRNDDEDYGPGYKEVHFDFYPHRRDNSFGDEEHDDELYYTYYVFYGKGEVDRVNIERVYKYRKDTGEKDDKGNPVRERVEEKDHKQFRSKGEVKKAKEQQAKEQKKKNKNGKKKKKGEKEEWKPYDKWDYDMELFDKIFDNDFMDEKSLKKDYRIDNDSVEIIADRKSIEVRYNDGHSVWAFYEGGEVYEVLYYEDSTKDECVWASGSASYIKKFFKKKGLVVEDKIIDDVYLDYDDDCLKNGVKHVNIKMEPAYPVKMELTVEAEDIKYTAQFGKKNPISGFRQKLLIKEAKGEFYRKNGRYKFKKEQKTITFDEPVELHPYWEDLWKGNFWTVKVDDDNIFYPHPHLALVDYRWRDKTRGLKNDVVELKVKTFGDFKKIKFTSSDTKSFDTKIGSGSTTKAEDTIKLKAKGSNEGYEDYLLATEEKKNEVTGCMYVHVYDPIHLKICFVNVHFFVVEFNDVDLEGGREAKFTGRNVVPGPLANTDASKGWKPEDDQYLQILGQAGIIFDDIATDEMYAEEYYVDAKDKNCRVLQSDFDMITGVNVPDYNEEGAYVDSLAYQRMWDSGLSDDPKLGDYVVSSDFVRKSENSMYGDFTAILDRQFMESHPSYGGYIRVYLLDKYMINDTDFDTDDEKQRRKEHWNLSRYQMSYNSCFEYSSSVLIFKKSIEKTNGTKSNPLANALLRYLGLGNSFDENAELNYAYRTTSNVMDFNDQRYTLNHKQWDDMREYANNLLSYLADDKKKWDAYAEEKKMKNKNKGKEVAQPSNNTKSKQASPSVSQQPENKQSVEHPPLFEMKQGESDPNAPTPKMKLLPPDPNAPATDSVDPNRLTEDGWYVMDPPDPNKKREFYPITVWK